jgi:N-acetylmuramoyl-L-alanine amidase
MIRRKFISNIFKLFCTLVIIPKDILAFFQQNYLGKSKSIKIISNYAKVEEYIPLYVKNTNEYISLKDFTKVMHYNIYTNDAKKKSVLYMGKDRIRFTADNSFVIHNDNALQMPLECKWTHGEILVPVIYFTQLLNQYTSFLFEYDIKAKTIIIEPSNVNITGIRLEEKENGTLIHVFASKKFNEKEIMLDIRNGWFHIDVYGGKIDTSSIAKIPGKGYITKIEGYQLGDTASLAFKLKGKIKSRDLVIQDSGNDFYVNLRTETILTSQNDNEYIKTELKEQKKKWYIDKIVLDAGHGGKDSGAPGYNKKINEKDIVLPIVLELGKKLNQKLPDVKIVYTRKTDVFIPLWKRTEIANKANGKLFISIHANGSTSKKLNGFETYFLSADKDEKATGVVLKENSVIEFEETVDRQRYEGVNFILATMAQSAFIKQSQYLASVIQSALKTKLEKIGMTDRGVKQGPFWVMVGATMPNVLVETGFMSNKYEFNKLIKSTTQNKIADAICQGIVKYKRDIEDAI